MWISLLRLAIDTDLSYFLFQLTALVCLLSSAFQIQGYGISLLRSFSQSHYVFKPLIRYCYCCCCCYHCYYFLPIVSIFQSANLFGELLCGGLCASYWAYSVEKSIPWTYTLGLFFSWCHFYCFKQNKNNRKQKL